MGQKTGVIFWPIFCYFLEKNVKNTVLAILAHFDTNGFNHWAKQQDIGGFWDSKMGKNSGLVVVKM